MATVPPYPNLSAAKPISPTQVRVTLYSRGDGGSPILEWQIGYGTNGIGPTETAAASSGNTVIGGFNSGQSVFFWARVRNAIGWSAWSARRSATTFKGPKAPSAVAFSELTQTSVRTQFTDPANEGIVILERQLGYGLADDAPTIFATPVNGVKIVTNLQAGETYYFWARNRNSVGWGPWSTRSQVNLIAGARVYVVGQGWRRAVPYVNDDGTWKMVQPYIKVAGVWRKTL